MRLWRRTAAEGPAETRAPAGAQGGTYGAEPRAAEGTPAEGAVRGAPVARSEAAPRDRGRMWRTREAGAATVGAIGSGVLLLARLVMLGATLIALLIGLAIVLRDVDANGSNAIVKGIHEGANLFAGAFTGLITFPGHPKRAISVDWGIALLVYLFVGALLARFIARLGRGGVMFEQRHRAAPSH